MSGARVPRLVEQGEAMKQTNSDRYLKEQLAGSEFARRFERAGEAWDVAMQLAALRRQAGLPQKELARRVKISQQQICRLESPDYEGHSLSMLRRVARELRARARVVIEPEEAAGARRVAEASPSFRTKRPRATLRTQGGFGSSRHVCAVVGAMLRAGLANDRNDEAASSGSTRCG